MLESRPRSAGIDPKYVETGNKRKNFKNQIVTQVAARKNRSTNYLHIIVTQVQLFEGGEI